MCFQYRLDGLQLLPLYTEVRVELPPPPPPRPTSWLHTLSSNIENLNSNLNLAISHKLSEITETIFSEENDRIKTYF